MSACPQPGVSAAPVADLEEIGHLVEGEPETLGAFDDPQPLHGAVVVEAMPARVSGSA